MGQFSWLDCRTDEQVLDCANYGLKRDVYVLVPEEFGGGHIKETCYDGYGNFGGHDIYDLVADWNQKYLDFVKRDDWDCDWVNGDDFKNYAAGKPYDCEKRIIGISLACYDRDNARLRYPIKITHDANAVYEYCAPSMSDPNQGWKRSAYDDYDEYDDYDD